MADTSYDDGFRVPKRRGKKKKEGQNPRFISKNKSSPSEVLANQISPEILELPLKCDSYTLEAVIKWKYGLQLK